MAGQNHSETKTPDTNGIDEKRFPPKAGSVQNYWNDRAVILNESLLKRGDDFYLSLASAYELAGNRIRKEIDAFYNRFAKDNKVTNGKRASVFSRQNGYEIRKCKTNDERFDAVNSYAYEVLERLFLPGA